MSDGAAGEPLEDRLGCVTGELGSIAELIGDPRVSVDAGEVADEVHSIAIAAAHTLRALAGWYERNADQLFDEHRGAEQDAIQLARMAERQLRAFAEDLHSVADRHAALIVELDHLSDRGAYELAFDELDDEEEYYAVVEVSYATATDEILRAFFRLDVARYHAQRLARRGTPGNVYRVVPVINGEQEPHVAQWPGEGDPDA